jgi:hypothetical protein
MSNEISLGKKVKFIKHIYELSRPQPILYVPPKGWKDKVRGFHKSSFGEDQKNWVFLDNWTMGVFKRVIDSFYLGKEYPIHISGLISLDK